MDNQQSEILGQIWQLLVRGGADRRSPLHTPVVTSVSTDGAPDARVMVLRKADPSRALLRFHTDARSPKCLALNGQRVAILGYHPAEKIQLRIFGLATIEVEGAEVDAAWAASSLFARRCYLAEQPPGTSLEAPGSGLPAEIEGEQPTEQQVAPARPNFALLHVHIKKIDWLYLTNSGHRRARFELNDNAWAAEWTAP